MQVVIPHCVVALVHDPCRVQCLKVCFANMQRPGGGFLCVELRPNSRHDSRVLILAHRGYTLNVGMRGSPKPGKPVGADMAGGAYHLPSLACVWCAWSITPRPDPSVTLDQGICCCRPPASSGIDGQFGRRRGFPMRDQRIDNPLRTSPVPMPHAPLIRNAVISKETCHPPPMARPLSGNTTSKATREGKIAPKRKATTQ
jgi:hypothetical protein